MIRRLIKYIDSFIPHRLPVGMTTFDALVAKVVYYSGLPDNDSTRRVAAQFIFHIAPSQSRVSVQTVATALRRTAALQVANEAFKNTQAKAPVLNLVGTTTDESETIPDPKSPLVS